MCNKPCKECPWVVRNKHNDTIVKFSERMDKPHNCHMVNKNIWDINEKEICAGRKLFISNKINMKKKKHNYWNYEACKKVSLKYTTRNQFALGDPSAYNTSWKNKWLGEFFPNTLVTKPRNYWNYETCREESLKYKNRSEFQRKNFGASSVSRKKNWFTIFYPNDKPIIIKKPKNYWNYETCREESLKYKTRVEFQKNKSGAHNISWKNKWLDEFFPNDKIKAHKYPRNYWNYERCKELSLKCNSRSNLSKNSHTAYSVSYRNKWLGEFFPNTRVVKPRNYWNYETCKEESLKYKTRKEFQKNKSGAHNISWKNKWLDEFFPIKNKNVKSIEEITQQIIEKEKKHSKSIENLYRMLANKI